MAETNRRCPFCGSVGEVQTHADALGRPEYRIRCKNCGAAMGTFWETKAQAAKWWNHRATDGQACSGCTWYRISEAFNWCELVHQKRDATDYCSKWRKA